MGPTITEEQIDTYARDGVLPLRQVFDPAWVELASAGLIRHLEAPTDRARIWDRDDRGATMFWDSQAWLGVEEYQRYVFESPAASIAGQLMQAQLVNFYFDAVFVRSHGSQFETPWHQDEPYWSVDGFNTCTVWMPLVPVKAVNALAFVPGSHLSAAMFDQYDFGLLNPDDKSGVDRTDFSAIAEAGIPDINADREGYGVVSWDLEPGDCVVFNSRIMHGGSGKLAEGDELKVFTTKWLGDDVRIVFREQGMDPDHSEIMTKYGLGPGDRPGTELYPLVWETA